MSLDMGEMCFCRSDNQEGVMVERDPLCWVPHSWSLLGGLQSQRIRKES